MISVQVNSLFVLLPLSRQKHPPRELFPLLVEVPALLVLVLLNTVFTDAIVAYVNRGENTRSSSLIGRAATQDLSQTR